MPLKSVIRAEEKTRRNLAILLGVGLLLLIFALAAAVRTMTSITEDTDRVEQTLARQATIMRLATANEQISAGRRGFLLQPDPVFAKVVREATADYERFQAELKVTLADEKTQSERLGKLEKLNAERAMLIDLMFADPQRAFDNARIYDFNVDRGVIITQQIRQIAETMAADEQAELADRNRSQLSSLVQFYIVGGVAIALLIVVLGAAVVMVLRFNRDLTRTQRQLRDVNEGLEAAVASRTAELTRANGEIQRFAYIVSHDLRSPLVNVLGFTSELEQARKDIRSFLERLFEERPELRDDHAWRAVDEDLPEAVGFIRTSTEKMDRLINSILDLSRQGRRQLAPERLEMTGLVENIAATLHQRAEDAGAEITIEKLPPLESDRVAVEQILSNLMENALKYLSPGRAGEVVVSGRKQGDKVMIEVADNGRGIAAEDHERIFELFRRAGPQDQAGEGIGLANVRALAYRLGGHVELDSKLDEGSRFRLILPEKFVAVEILA